MFLNVQFDYRTADKGGNIVFCILYWGELNLYYLHPDDWRVSECEIACTSVGSGAAICEIYSNLIYLLRGHCSSLQQVEYSPHISSRKTIFNLFFIRNMQQSLMNLIQIKLSDSATERFDSHLDRRRGSGIVESAYNYKNIIPYKRWTVPVPYCKFNVNVSIYFNLKPTRNQTV